MISMSHLFPFSVNREATSTVDIVVRPFVRTSRFNNVPAERLLLPGIYIFTYYARIRYIYHGSFSSLLILEVKFAGRLKTTLGRRIFGRTPQCFRRGFRPGCKILYSSRSFSYFCFFGDGFCFCFSLYADVFLDVNQILFIKANAQRRRN